MSAAYNRKPINNIHADINEIDDDANFKSLDSHQRMRAQMDLSIDPCQDFFQEWKSNVDC